MNRKTKAAKRSSNPPGDKKKKNKGFIMGVGPGKTGKHGATEKSMRQMNKASKRKYNQPTTAKTKKRFISPKRNSKIR